MAVAWRATGTPAQDFGTVPTGFGVNDYLDIDVNHNMDPSQTFALGGSVDKNMGPDWVAGVHVYDGTDYRDWTQATFGATQYFTTPIGGSSQSFTVPVEVTFDVDNGQAFGTFQFEIELIVTSL